METNIQPGSQVKNQCGDWYTVIARNEYRSFPALPDGAVPVKYDDKHQTYIYASRIIDVRPPAPKPKVTSDRYTPGSEVQSRGSGRWYKVLSADEYNGKWAVPSNAVPIELGDGVHTYIYESNIAGGRARKTTTDFDNLPAGTTVLSKAGATLVLTGERGTGAFGDWFYKTIPSRGVYPERIDRIVSTRDDLPAGTVVANKTGGELTLTGEKHDTLDGRWYYETVNPAFGVWPEYITRIVSLPEARPALSQGNLAGFKPIADLKIEGESKFDNLLSAVLGQSKPEAETDADDRETWNTEILELAADFKRQVTFLYKTRRTPYAAWGDGMSTTRSFVPERVEYRDGKTYVVENDEDGYRTYRLDRIDGYVMVLAQ